MKNIILLTVSILFIGATAFAAANKKALRNKEQGCCTQKSTCCDKVEACCEKE